MSDSNVPRDSVNDPTPSAHTPGEPQTPTFPPSPFARPTAATPSTPIQPSPAPAASTPPPSPYAARPSHAGPTGSTGAQHTASGTPTAASPYGQQPSGQAGYGVPGGQPSAPVYGHPGAGQHQTTGQHSSTGQHQGAGQSAPAAQHSASVSSPATAPSPGSAQPYSPAPSHSPAQPHAGTSAPAGQTAFGNLATVQTMPGQQGSGQQGPGQPPATGRSADRPKGMWPRMIAVAAVTAVLASGLTGAGFALADRNDAATPSSYTNQQQSGGEVPVKNSTVTNPDWTAVAAAVSPSVVAISVQFAQGASQGSGVVYDDQGHIVTNNHVIEGAQNNGTILVTMSDGRVFQATVVGTDESTDLAVIKLTDPPSDLVPATFGDSSKVAVGDPIMAVGNPLGLNNTATTGIVSAVNRPVTTMSESQPTSSSQAAVTNAIQLDAAINPGNSGGPAFNAYGEVVGITSSIATLSSDSGSQSGSIGLGFAIPVNVAKNIAGQLIESGRAQHALLGVSLADGAGEVDGVTRQGAEISKVSGGKAAEKAGIRTGDVVIAMNGSQVSSATSLMAFVRGETVGSTVTLTVIRDGEALDIPVTLTEAD